MTIAAGPPTMPNPGAQNKGLFFRSHQYKHTLVWLSWKEDIRRQGGHSSFIWQNKNKAACRTSRTVDSGTMLRDSPGQSGHRSAATVQCSGCWATPPTFQLSCQKSHCHHHHWIHRMSSYKSCSDRNHLQMLSSLRMLTLASDEP